LSVCQHFPRACKKILELTRNINCLPKELVAVIEKDPVKILKIINSAFYGLPNKDVRTLVCTHHEPTRTDDELEKIFAEAVAGCGYVPGENGAPNALLASEGLEIVL
jgi:hypothetical protein